MSAPSSVFAVKATRVAAPQQQQQQPLKAVQPQPPAENVKPVKPEAAPRGATPVQPPAAAAAAEVGRGTTPVNASRRTLVLKSYPELKKECEEATAVGSALWRARERGE